MSKKIRVGLIFNSKKCAEFKSRGIFESTESIEFVTSDENVDLLLSKVSDDVNYDRSVKQIVDPELQRLTHDRFILSSTLRSCGVNVPDFQLHSSPRTFDCTWICKSRKACGAAFAHLMALVENTDHMKQVEEAFPAGEPVFSQKFIPHDKSFFKVFVIGNVTRVLLRPSISSELKKGEIFDSQDMKKYSCGGAVVSDEDKNQLAQISKRIEDNLRLHFFGFDAVKDESGTFYVVDVNYFPTYNEIDDLNQLLTNFITEHFSPLVLS
jgi:glutathione synthase/RimK-type ligase-like ATP-grasp enzyme